MRNAVLIGTMIFIFGTVASGLSPAQHVLSPGDCKRASYGDDMVLSFGDGTGDSFETAVAITGHTCMSLDDVVEYYLRSRFPGHNTKSREEVNDLGRMYLIVKFNQDGAEKLMYFYTSPYLVLRKIGEEDGFSG